MRLLSQVVSVIFHPLLLNFLLVLAAFGMDRYAYYIDEPHRMQVFLIMSFFILILFPFVGMAVFRGLGVIPSWAMADKKDRIAPLITAMVFYIWYFINIKNNAAIPVSLEFIALGAATAIGIAFFINNFSKISLHAVGAGAFLMGIILLVFHTQASYIEVHLPWISQFRLSSIFALFIAVAITGMVGTSRLYLGKHSLEDIIGGYLAGIVSMLFAFNIII